MTAQKTLFILRHAKAVTAASGQHDRDRELAERGVREATVMGKHLATRNIVPAKIICSASTRTRETFQCVQEGFKVKLPVEYSEKLYMASANEMLTMLAEIEESVASVMLIGHNPGMHELAVKLSTDGEERLFSQLSAEFPTCTMATITFENGWNAIRSARGTLADLVVAKRIL